MSGLQRVWTTTGIATKGINFRGYQRQQMVNLSVLDEQLFFCNEKNFVFAPKRSSDAD